MLHVRPPTHEMCSAAAISLTRLWQVKNKHRSIHDTRPQQLDRSSGACNRDSTYPNKCCTCTGSYGCRCRHCRLGKSIGSLHKKRLCGRRHNNSNSKHRINPSLGIHRNTLFCILCIPSYPVESYIRRKNVVSCCIDRTGVRGCHSSFHYSQSRPPRRRCRNAARCHKSRKNSCYTTRRIQTLYNQRKTQHHKSRMRRPPPRQRTDHIERHGRGHTEPLQHKSRKQGHCRIYRTCGPPHSQGSTCSARDSRLRQYKGTVYTP